MMHQQRMSDQDSRAHLDVVLPSAFTLLEICHLDLQHGHPVSSMYLCEDNCLRMGSLVKLTADLRTLAVCRKHACQCYVAGNLPLCSMGSPDGTAERSFRG